MAPFAVMLNVTGWPTLTFWLRDRELTASGWTIAVGIPEHAVALFRLLGGGVLEHAAQGGEGFADLDDATCAALTAHKVRRSSGAIHLEELWIRDVTITTGLVDTSTIPTLLRLLTSHQLDAARFVTHHFTLDQMMEAYDVFARAVETKALKVVLKR